MTAPRLQGLSMRSGSGFAIAGNVVLNATTTSSRVELPANGGTLIVRNYGPGRAYIQLGNSAVVAVADTAYPVEFHDADLIYRDGSEGYLAAITDSPNGAKLHITAGEGLPYV